MYSTIDTQNETSTRPKSIFECLEIKRRAFTVFLQATLSLKGAIEDGDADRIDDLIDARENCVSAVSVIDDHIGALSKADPGYYARLSEDGKEKLKAVSDAIESLLDQLKIVNGECILSGTQRVNMIQNELSGTTGSIHRAWGGYRQEQDPRFVDITS